MPLPSDNSLVFRTTDATKWGTGKGAPLSKSEFDNNQWWLLEQLAFIEANPALPEQINSISVSSGQITITLTGGTVFGPYDIPQQAFRWMGAYTGGTSYEKFDVFTSSEGAYLTLIAHTAPTDFNAALTSAGNPVYALMFPYQNIYDLSFFFPGIVGAAIGVGEPMFAVLAARDFYLPASLPLSVAAFKINPVDGVWTTAIKKNGSSVGSYTYDPTASTPHGFFTFTADVQFNAGDLLEVDRPTTIDSVAKGFILTLAAKKGTP